MPLDLTQELMTEYETQEGSVGYALLDDGNLVVGYVVEGEGTDPREAVAANTYEYYDALGQFEKIEYEFTLGGVQWVNTYHVSIDEDSGDENNRHVGEWKLTAGNVNEDNTAFTTVELAEWYIVPEITEHLPDVVWDHVYDQGEGTVRHDITVANVLVSDLEAAFGASDSEPPQLEIVSDLTTVSSNTYGILAWFNVDGTTNPMTTEGYYNSDIGNNNISSIPDAMSLEALVNGGSVINITSDWEAYNSDMSEEGHSEGGMRKLPGQEMLAAVSFFDNGEKVYSVTETVTEDSIVKTQTAFYDDTGILFMAEVGYTDSEGNLVSETYDPDEVLIESAVVNLGVETDGVYNQVTVEFYVVSEDITLDAPPVLSDVMGTGWPGYYEGIETYSGVTVDQASGDLSFESATKVSEEVAIYLENETLVAWSVEDENGVQAYLNEAAEISSDLTAVPADPSSYRNISTEVAAWNAEQASTINFLVDVVSTDSGNKYRLFDEGLEQFVGVDSNADGIAPVLELVPGHTYVFTQVGSDMYVDDDGSADLIASTNSGHPLHITTTSTYDANAISPLSTVTTEGDNGVGRVVTVTVPDDATDTTLYYVCEFHPDMGNTSNVFVTDTTTPDSGTTTPDSGTTTPDSGTTTPDSGTTTPDSGTTTPDSGTTTPDTGGYTGSDGSYDHTDGSAKTEAELAGMESIGEGDEILYFESKTDSWDGGSETVISHYGPAGLFVYEDVIFVSNMGSSSYRSEVRRDEMGNELEYTRVSSFEGEVSTDKKWAEEAENGEYTEYFERDDAYYYSLEAITYSANPWANEGVEEINRYQVSGDEYELYESGNRLIDNVYADVPGELIPQGAEAAAGKEQFSRTIEGASIVDGEIVMGESAIITKSWYERYLENGNFVGSVDSEDGIDTIQYPDPDNSNDRITVTRVSEDFLESLDDATAEGWVNPHEFYVGKGAPTAIFTEEEAQQINKVGHVVSEHTHDDDYGENFDPGQSPDGGMAGGDTQSTSLDSKTTYLGSDGKIFMVIEYSLNEGGGSTSEYMNVTRYDASGDVTSRIDGFSDSWQGSSYKSFQEYNGDYQFQGGEYTNGNTTEVFDENWNLVDSYVSIDTSGAVAFDSLDDAQAVELIETYYPETVSVVADYEQYEDNWGGDSVTRTNSTGSVVLLDGNNDIVGQLSVWEQYVGEELESRSVELMDAGGQHIGNINVYGNSLDSNFIERFETAQTSSYTLDGVDTSFKYYEESTWENADISYDDNGSMVTTVIESSTYYFDNNWNLVYGEWNSGAVTTQYGEGWQIIGTSSNIADDAWTAVEGQEGVYQYVTERVEQHDDDYAMPGMAGGGSSTNTEVEILYSVKEGEEYVVTGRVEEYRWESEDGEYNTSSNEYDADGNMVSSSWEDSFGNQGSYGSVVETRTIDGVDKEVTVESGSNGSSGWFYAYEYVYDEEWNFLEGYEINNGQKTSYGANWERLETTVAIDESQKDALDEVTQDMSVLESFADDAAFRGETNAYEDNFGDGSFSQVTYQYYNEDYELLYSEEFFTWEDESGYSSTSSNYQNAENEWIGSSHSDSDGNESSNISYTEVREIDGTDVSVRVESGSFTDGSDWSETYEYVYGENYNLIEGKLEQNGLVTVYGENWEVTSTGLDPDGDYVFTALEDGSGNYEVTLGEFSESGEGQVRVLVFDGDDVNANLVQSRETWRWSDPSGYWSENYSIYDADGNWVGSGSNDNNGFYYKSSETTQDLAAADYTFLDSDYTDARVSSNESGNSEQDWSESSVWYYESDWTFLGGTQTSDGMVVTYDSNWTIIDTAVDTSDVVLVEVLDDDGNLDGYYFEQSLGGNHGAMAAGGNQDATENQDTRTVYLDVDGETVTGSKETFYWDDGFGRTSISETYYDADGNWLSSSHESSDGYKSSYSQDVVEDDSGNVTGYVSSGTSVDPDGSSHSYEYTYNSNWSLVSGWEVRDDVRVEYGEGWVETARTVEESDDVVYTDVRDALGELTGYSTKKVVDESEGQDGISAKTTTTRFYDLEKEFTGYREKFVYSDETYRTASTTEYDADNNVIFEKYEDSEGFTFERLVENQYAEDRSLTGYIETGEELNPEGQDFEWSYTYDADGNFLGGTEIFDGATTRYGENWEVVSVQGDVRALDAVADADGTVTGYYNESSNDISDQFGLFSMEETVRQEYSTTGQYVQEVVSYETTIDGETRTGMTVENSDEEIVFSQSENEAGDASVSGVYNDASEVEREYYLSVDEAGLSGSVGMTSSFFETDTPGENDDGVIADASTSTVTLYSDGTEASSYKYTAEFFGDLLSLDSWTVNEAAFTANNQVELSDEMTALYADATQLDGYAEGTSTKLILASLLKDYSYEEMLDNDLKSNGEDPDLKEVSDATQKGSAVAGTDSDGKAYIMFDSGSGHGMVLQGEFNKVDPNTEDDSSIKSQLASGNITSIKIYSAQNNGDIDQDADNIALEVSGVRVALSNLYNNLDDLVLDAEDGTVLNAARYDIA